MATAFITPDGQRTFLDYLAAAAELTADDITDNMLAGYKYLYLEGYLVQNHALVDSGVSTAKRMGMKICLDMASYNIVESDLEYFTTLVRNYVDIVFANEEEAKAFAGGTPEEALETLAQTCSIAIVKLGARGSLVCKGTQVLEVAPVQVSKVADTTGAGDYFAAGFLYGLVTGCSLEKCARIASILAAKVIQVVGAELTAACWKDIKKEIENL